MNEFAKKKPEHTAEEEIKRFYGFAVFLLKAANAIYLTQT